MEKEYIQILNRIDSLKSEIDTFRPIAPDIEGRIVQKLRLDWNYNSLAIEGNSLNYGETIAFIMHGVTAKGKPLKDHLDLKGHNKAIDFIMEIVKNFDRFTESDLRQLHELILVEPYEVDAVTPDGKPTKKMITIGSYKTSPNHVQTKTGEIHYYASVEDTPAKMTDLMRWFNKMNHDSEVHPLIFATFFHHKFVAIHPFDDGNGRMARLLMNLILLKNHFPPIVVKLADRNEYYGALAQADAGDMSALISFLGENLIHSLEIYLKGAKGEEINEPTDTDKEIALYKKEILGKGTLLKIVHSDDVERDLYFKRLPDLFRQLNEKLQNIKDLFLTTETYYLLQNNAKYEYKKMNIDNNRQNINFFISMKNDKSSTIIFRLNNFVLLDNSFSIELRFNLTFEKNHYSIAYTITNARELENVRANIYLNEIYSDKQKMLYHEDIDIVNYIQSVYGQIFSYTKNREANSGYGYFSVSEFELLQFLKKYLPITNVILNSNLIFIYPQANELISDKSFIRKIIKEKYQIKHGFGIVIINS